MGHLGLKSFEPPVLQYFFSFFQSRVKDPWPVASLRLVYEQGFTLRFRGGRPSDQTEELYALDWAQCTERLPLVVTVAVRLASASSRHDDLLGPDTLAAGLFLRGCWDSFSASWLSKITRESPAYLLGEQVNKVFLLDLERGL